MTTPEAPLHVVRRTIYALVKLVEKREYADAFADGELYMNPLSYFLSLPDSGELRADQYEGLVGIYQPSPSMHLEIAGTRVDHRDLTGALKVQSVGLSNAWAYCMYSIDSRGVDTITEDDVPEFTQKLMINDQCFRLGGYAAVVTNVEKFFERVHQALQRHRLNYSRGAITYIDEGSQHGNLMDKPGFYKFREYEFQNEYRILVRSTGVDRPEPLRLQVGSLRDIVRIMTPQEFNRTLEVGLPEVEEPGC